MSEEVGFVVGDDSKPNPEDYKIHMRTVQTADDAGTRHNDFVGSYSNTGRVKLEKKKWSPANKPEEGDNVFRSDDWMGSGKVQRKSWRTKSKSISNVVTGISISNSNEDKNSSDDDCGVSVRSNSSQVRRWKPPPKTEATPPPWMSTASSSSPTKTRSSTTPARRASTMPKWKPTSPASKPISAMPMGDTDTDTTSAEMTLSDLQSGSSHSRVKDVIDKLSGSLSNLSGSNPISNSNTVGRSWQSHGVLDLTNTAAYNSSDAAMDEDESDNSDDEVEVTSDDEGDDEEKATPALPESVQETAEKDVYEVESSDDEEYEVASVKSYDEEIEVESSDEEESQEMVPKNDVTETAQVPAPVALDAIGQVIEHEDDDGGKPNPEEYKIQMRTVQASEDAGMRHDDFVGSYSNTGRVKLQKKKWAPSKAPEKGDNAFRSDDWMGSGKTQRKSWHVKS